MLFLVNFSFSAIFIRGNGARVIDNLFHSYIRPSAVMRFSIPSARHSRHLMSNQQYPRKKKIPTYWWVLYANRLYTLESEKKKAKSRNHRCIQQGIHVEAVILYSHVCVRVFSNVYFSKLILDYGNCYIELGSKSVWRMEIEITWGSINWNRQIKLFLFVKLLFDVISGLLGIWIGLHEQWNKIKFAI